MRVVRGRDVVEWGAQDLDRVLGAYEGLTIDVGTGDGRFAYNYARLHPERFVVGLDPSRDQLREMSTRSGRKPSRGGLANVMFVWGTVEDPPEALRGGAGEVHVVLPWGTLMTGLVEARPCILAGLRALGRPGSSLRLVLGADVWTDPVPVDLVDLPEVTVEFVEGTLAPAYLAQGIEVLEVRRLTRDEIAAIPSTWARRLAHGRPWPWFIQVTAAITSGQPVASPR